MAHNVNKKKLSVGVNLCITCTLNVPKLVSNQENTHLLVFPRYDQLSGSGKAVNKTLSLNHLILETQ